MNIDNGISINQKIAKLLAREHLQHCLDILRTIATVAGAIVAVLAYRMGQKYFDRGQSNQIPMEKYKRALASICETHAALAETARILKKLFESDTVVLVEGHMREITDNHDRVMAATKSAMFVAGINEIRNDYIKWYDAWFVDSHSDSSLILLGDKDKRRGVYERTHDAIFRSFNQLMEKLAKIEHSEKPDVVLAPQ